MAQIDITLESQQGGTVSIDYQSISVADLPEGRIMRLATPASPGLVEDDQLVITLPLSSLKQLRNQDILALDIQVEGQVLRLWLDELDALMNAVSLQIRVLKTPGGLTLAYAYLDQHKQFRPLDINSLIHSGFLM